VVGGGGLWAARRGKKELRFSDKSDVFWDGRGGAWEGGVKGGGEGGGGGGF